MRGLLVLFFGCGCLALVACGGGGGGGGSKPSQNSSSTSSSSSSSSSNSTSSSGSSSSSSSGGNSTCATDNTLPACDMDDDGVTNENDIDDDGDGLIEVSTLEELDWMRNDLTGSSLTPTTDEPYIAGCPSSTGCNGYELTADVDFDTNQDGVVDANDAWFDYDDDGSNAGWLPIGAEQRATPITTLDNAGCFDATFDGNNHRISNLFINRPDKDYVGFWGCVYNSNAGRTRGIRNLRIDHASLSGNDNVGILIGYAYFSFLENIVVSGNVDGNDSVGGLVGFSGRNLVTNALSTGSVSGRRIVGGLAGSVFFSTIKGGFSSSDVSVVDSETYEHSYAGGLLGYISESSLRNSASIGTVSVADTALGRADAGGLIGHSYATTIETSFSTGNVSGAQSAGGFFGGLSDVTPPMTIACGYSVGDVEGEENVGQFGGSAEVTINSGNNEEIFSSNYFAIDGADSALPAIGTVDDASTTTEIRGYNLDELGCPTAAGDTTCVSGHTLYENWENCVNEDDEPVWDFGDNTQLPGLIVGDVIYRDSNLNGIFDHLE